MVPKIYSRLATLTLLGGLAVELLANCGGSSVGSGDGGGGGGGGAACPASAPDNQSACTAGTTSPCTYSGSVVCDCGGGAMPVWTCTACPVCPTAQPMMGSMCTAGGATCAALPSCTYGTTDCTCAAGGGGGPGGGGNTWSCGTCPATQPAAAGVACTARGLKCDYAAGTTCTCEGADWVCVTPPPACPSAEPTTGDTCTADTGGFAGCVYTAGTCRCRPPAGGGRGPGGAAADAAMPAGDTWECVAAPPACPATEPAAASSCTLGTGGGAGCTYGAATCRCRAGGPGADAGDVWTCG